MKANEMRELSAEEMISRENDLRAKIFDLKVRHNTGVLESTSELSSLKKDLARVLTVRTELEHKLNPEKKRR